MGTRRPQRLNRVVRVSIGVYNLETVLPRGILPSKPPDDSDSLLSDDVVKALVSKINRPPSINDINLSITIIDLIFSF